MVKTAGTDRIGHRATGNRALKGAGDDRYLGRTTRGPAGNCIGEIDKEFADPGFFQKGAKQDEEENETGRHAEWDAENTLGGEIHVGNDAIERIAPMREKTRHVWPEIGIHQKGGGDGHDGQTDNPTCRFKSQQGADGPDDII